MTNEHRDDAPEPAEIVEQTTATGAVDEQIAELQERLLRSQAELENFRKRSRREYDDAQRYREIDVLRDLLPVFDNVLRAVEAAERTTDVDSLRAGFRMTAQLIEKVIQSHGCQSIDAEGKPFDPAIHDCILHQPTPGVVPGTVVGVASRGYSLHDRVVRPAQVIVSKE